MVVADESVAMGFEKVAAEFGLGGDGRNGFGILPGCGK